MTRDHEDRILGVRLRALRLGRGVPPAVPGDPSDDELLRYLDGALPRSDRRRVEARLARSPLARDRLGILTRTLAEVGEEVPATAPAAGPADLVRLVLLVARDALQFLRGDLLPVAVAGAGAVRGPATAAPTYCDFATRFGDLAVSLTLDRAHDRVDARLVMTSASGQPVTDCRVTLRSGDRTLASVPCEPDGSAHLGVPPEGRYVLELRRRGTPLGRLALDLEASHSLPQ
jgi:hypothetical protein